MSLITWSWLFLALYIAGMLALGAVGQRRIRRADDFATARGGYGPLFLAFAFAATTTSGATFLGGPGLAYEWGLANAWSNFLYPIGVYLGVLISMRFIATAGNRFGNRSIPECLGNRYGSGGIRVLVSLFSLVLFFYLAGQLVSDLVMFEKMLGLTPFWALLITTTALILYVALSGAHTDILTDGAQGFMMLMLAIIAIVLFLWGVGVEGGIRRPLGLRRAMARRHPRRRLRWLERRLRRVLGVAHATAEPVLVRRRSAARRRRLAACGRAEPVLLRSARQVRIRRAHLRRVESDETAAGEAHQGTVRPRVTAWCAQLIAAYLTSRNAKTPTLSRPGFSF